MPIGKYFKAMAFVCLVALCGTHLSAQITYLTNTANGSNYGAEIDSSQWLAQSFITGTNLSGYTLDSTQLMLGAAGTAPAFTVSLYSDVSTAPGTLVSALTTTGTPDGTLNATLNFTPTSPTTLAPSTTYWLVTSSTAAFQPSTNYLYQSFNYTSTSYTASDGWTIPTTDLLSSSNSGSSWGSFGSSNALFSVSAFAAVPEPSNYVLVDLGLAALIFVCARRRRA